ncbi:hypothetical protein U1Q18_029318, partial [Sarracenia purpurea var. burkii]
KIKVLRSDRERRFHPSLGPVVARAQTSLLSPEMSPTPLHLSSSIVSATFIHLWDPSSLVLRPHRCRL